MTKVYLVYFEGITESNSFIKEVWGVFTNKRKALAYCEYRNELADEKFLETLGFQSVEFKMEVSNIWKYDFTPNLKKKPF